MKVSILVPYHDMPDTARFLERLMRSIKEQTHKDYEIVLMKEGRMGKTYNACIKKATGDVLKFMGMDDYFAHEDALKDIVDSFVETPQAWWVATGCLHDDEHEGRVWHHHVPKWNDKLYYGYNSVGGFATISLRNKDVPPIDEDLDWVVDCDWYWRIYKQHGLPHVIPKATVVIGVGPHQTTDKLSTEQKEREYEITRARYGQR